VTLLVARKAEVITYAPDPVPIGFAAVRTRLLIPAAALLAALTLALPATAGATGRKIAVGNFAWSPPEVQVNLNEYVTWVWVGPDLQHSITGLSANALGFDSDPGNPSPDHKLGDTFRIQFTRPGVYDFHCKLHAIVRGRVVVSATPGDPSSDPDPMPAFNVDLTPPELTEVRLARSTFPYSGTDLRFTLDERARVEMAISQVLRGGRLKYWMTRRFDGHVGWNEAQFNPRVGSRPLRPGRYRAVLRAWDTDNNVSKRAVVRFSVRR
jgi:plastocyanin